MAIIDSTYFHDQLNIPNINSTTDLGDELRAELVRYINVFEPQFLKLLFGNDFYDLFIQGIENDEARMLTLKSKFIDEDLLLSPIANYVFFYYAKVKKEMVFGVRDDAGNYTLNGVNHLTEVWNDLSEKSLLIYEFLKDNRSTYPEFNQMFQLSYINNFGI
jgi:hypothetical protein